MQPNRKDLFEELTEMGLTREQQQPIFAEDTRWEFGGNGKATNKNIINIMVDSHPDQELIMECIKKVASNMEGIEEQIEVGATDGIRHIVLVKSRGGRG